MMDKFARYQAFAVFCKMIIFLLNKVCNVLILVGGPGYVFILVWVSVYVLILEGTLYLYLVTRFENGQ